MKKIFSVTLVLIFVALSVVCGFAHDSSFHFDSEGKFTVLQLTDPQDDQYPAHKLGDFITKAVENTDPDLVVITGDLVEDERLGDVGTDDKNLQEGVLVDGDYEKTLENVKTAVAAIFAPLENAGVFYTVTQGNNDYKSGISNEDWLKIYAQYPHCIVTDQSDDPDGKIDSFIEIKKFASNEPAFGLWLLDNGRGFTDGQKNWFKKTNMQNLPSIVFEHIPIDDVGNLFEKCHIWDSGALIGEGGIYRLNPQIAAGTNYVVSTPCETTDEFLMFKEKNVIGAFFGHEHTDGYTGTYDGITMGLTYGCQFAKAGPYGYRVVEISQDGTFTTDLYTYAKDDFSLQTDESNTQPDNFAEKLFNGILNTFKFVFKQFSAWFKF